MALGIWASATEALGFASGKAVSRVFLQVGKFEFFHFAEVFQIDLFSCAPYCDRVEYALNAKPQLPAGSLAGVRKSDFEKRFALAREKHPNIK
jgi:hypothetical protein